MGPSSRHITNLKQSILETFNIFRINTIIIIFLVKWVPNRGPEQRESSKTVLYMLNIVIILISNILYIGIAKVGEIGFYHPLSEKW